MSLRLGRIDESAAHLLLVRRAGPPDQDMVKPGAPRLRALETGALQLRLLEVSALQLRREYGVGALQPSARETGAL
jgi:hypothetical protein